MDIRFYRATPTIMDKAKWPEMTFDDSSTFTVVMLHRDADPDAFFHDGQDYLGAYGEGGDIDAWASAQSLIAVSRAELPDRLSFYPAPFNEA